MAAMTVKQMKKEVEKWLDENFFHTDMTMDDIVEGSVLDTIMILNGTIDELRMVPRKDMEEYIHSIYIAMHNIIHMKEVNRHG